MPKTKYKIGQRVEIEITTKDGDKINDVGEICGVTYIAVKSPLYDIRMRNDFYFEQIPEKFIKRAVFGGKEKL